MNSVGRDYGVELWRWAAMVVLRMGDDEEKGDRKRGLERNEEEA